MNSAGASGLLDVLAGGRPVDRSAAWLAGDPYDGSRHLTLTFRGAVGLAAPSVPDRRAGLDLRVVADLGTGPLLGPGEFRVDLLARLPAPRLDAPLLRPDVDAVVAALAGMAGLLGDALVPAAVAVLVGADLPSRDIEVHIQARPANQALGVPQLRDLLDLGSLGPLQGANPPSGGGEVLRRDLVAVAGWMGAVREALTVVALDWGYPEAEVGLAASAPSTVADVVVTGGP